jgi:hypothetical protein
MEGHVEENSVMSVLTEDRINLTTIQQVSNQSLAQVSFILGE